MRIFIVLLLLAMPSFAAQSDVESYLNNIQNLTADFVQLDANGNSAKGKFYLTKPGKFRWEYEDQPLLIVSSGRLLTYFDKELNEVTHVPTADTLAAFIARDEIKLNGGDVQLLEYSEKGGVIKVIVTQKEKPEEGSLALYFDKSPIKLTSMQVIDTNGSTTQLFFENQDFTSKVDQDKFVFKDPNFHKNAWE